MKVETEKTTGIFIYENPEDFLEAIEHLKECYLASNPEGVVKHE